MTRSEVSCKGCKERYEKCHEKCPRYRKWKELWEKEKEWNRQKNAALFDGYSSRRKAIKSAAKISRPFGGRKPGITPLGGKG